MVGLLPYCVLLLAQQEVSFPCAMRTYPEIANALSVGGKHVECVASIRDRAALISLKSRSWDSATSALSKGLGIRFVPDDKDPVRVRMEADPAVDRLEKTLWQSYVSTADREIKEALQWFDRYRAKGSLDTPEQVMELMAEAAGNGGDARGWVKLLQSDLPESQKAGLFLLLDTARNRSTSQFGDDSIVAYFRSGGTLRGLVPNGLTQSGGTDSWNERDPYGAAMKAFVKRQVDLAWQEAQASGDRSFADPNTFQAALADTVFVQDVYFSPWNFGEVEWFYKSFCPSYVGLLASDRGLALSDLTALSSNKLASLLQSSGAPKAMDEWKASTDTFLSSKQAGKLAQAEGPVSSVSELFEDWSKRADIEIVMEWDLVRETGSALRQFLLERDRPGAPAPVHSTLVEWFQPRVVDRKARAYRGLGSSGTWVVEEADGVTLVKSSLRFVDRQYRAPAQPYVALRNKAILKPGSKVATLPLEDLLAFVKAAKPSEMQLLAEFDQHLYGTDLATVYPVMHWLSALPKKRVDQLFKTAKEGEKAEILISAGNDAAVRQFADDMRAVGLGIGRRDRDVVFLGMAFHPGFQQYAGQSKLVIFRMGPNKGFFFNLVAPPNPNSALPGGPTFGPVYIDLG